MFRCALFISGDMVMCQTGFYGAKGYRPNFLYGLQVFYGFSLAVWLAELASRTVNVMEN